VGTAQRPSVARKRDQIFELHRERRVQHHQNRRGGGGDVSQARGCFMKTAAASKYHQVLFGQRDRASSALMRSAPISQKLERRASDIHP